MKNLILVLSTVGALSFANTVTLSVERDPLCKNMCNTEITGQACIAKAGAFSGPTWLATEWMNAKPEVNMNVIRIIPTTSRWVAVKELKLYIKNAEGNVQEKIFDLGLNRIHNCETLIIKTQDKMIVTDMEMFVRGEADNIDIGTEIAE